MIYSDENTNTDIPKVDLGLLVEQLEELHPLAFRQAFGLTHEAAAEELALEPQTMRAYSKKEPSKRVKKLAATITRQWLSSDRPLINPEPLIQALSFSKILQK
jgi:hypothetical protein